MNPKKRSPVELFPYFTIFLLGLYFILHLGYSININYQAGKQLDLMKVINTISHTVEKEPLIFLEDFSMSNAIGKLTIFYIIISLLTIAIFALDKKKYMKGKEYGSADWATKKDSEKLMDKKNLNNNIILTADTYLSLDTRKTRKNLNVIVFGGSGAGKTRFFVKPNVMQMNTSYVITDPKGELLRSTGKMLEKNGYKVKVFNLIQMQHSTNYNPFQYIRNDNDIMKLINNLIKNTDGGKKSSDPFWEKAETALLMAIMSLIWYEGEKSEKNFGMVMELLRQAEVREEDETYESPLDILFKELKEIDPDHIAVKYYTVFKQASGKTAKSILISCSVRLAIFNLQEVKKLTSSDDIDIPKLGEEKTALFIVIPDSDDTFNCLVAILYSQIFDTLYNLADFKHNGRLPVHVRCIIDEFANIGTIPNFDKLIATMRSREISVNPILQNLSQLETMYKDNWETIVGNCDSFLFLGGMEKKSLEYLNKSLGKATIDTLNRSISRGKNSSTSRNEGILGRELMTINEIREMPDSDCILLVRGVKPFYNKKFDIKKHENYKMLEDANIENAFDVTNFKTKDYSKGSYIGEDDTEKVLYYVEEMQISEHDEYVPEIEYSVEEEEKRAEKEEQEEQTAVMESDVKSRIEDINIIIIDDEAEKKESKKITEGADIIINDMIKNLVEEAEIEETDQYLFEYELQDEEEQQFKNKEE